MQTMQDYEKNIFWEYSPMDATFIPIHRLHPGGIINLLKASDWIVTIDR